MNSGIETTDDLHIYVEPFNTVVLGVSCVKGPNWGSRRTKNETPSSGRGWARTGYVICGARSKMKMQSSLFKNWDGKKLGFLRQQEQSTKPNVEPF